MLSRTSEGLSATTLCHALLIAHPLAEDNSLSVVAALSDQPKRFNENKIRAYCSY